MRTALARWDGAFFTGQSPDDVGPHGRYDVGMGLAGLLALVMVGLLVAALVEYVFFAEHAGKAACKVGFP